MISTALFFAAIGAVVGMLGGGGSILLLPILVYVTGLSPSQAITLSLLVVAVTSSSALPTYVRAGHVEARTGLLVGAGGMLGALLVARARRGCGDVDGAASSRAVDELDRFGVEAEEARFAAWYVN